MKVKRENLLSIAGVVWLIAGLNILIIGLTSYFSDVWAFWQVLLLVLGSVATFLLFHSMFSRLVGKHVRRIRNYEDERQNPLLFFDLKSYLIMFFMIALGVTLRVSGWVPAWFIAFFYVGLGTALALAGVGFLMHRFHGYDWTFHKRIHVQKSK